MTKPANCLTCGDTNPVNFYYGNKKFCKKCKIKQIMEKNKKTSEVTKDSEIADYSERVIALEKYVSDLTQVVETIKQQHFSEISELKKEIETLKSKFTIPPRGRSPSPVRASSPKRATTPLRVLSPKRSPSPKKRSPSPKKRSPSPVKFTNLEPLPIPQVKFTCSELNQMANTAENANMVNLKKLADKLNVSKSQNGYPKNVDQLRKDILGKIKTLQN
jgi:hypothetical protein